jgi:hypothetical protein
MLLLMTLQTKLFMTMLSTIKQNIPSNEKLTMEQLVLIAR